jgi:MFS family permease
MLLLKIPGRQVAGRPREPIWRNLADGLKYAAINRQLRALLLLSVLVETFGFSYIVMLPVIARDVLRVWSTGLGYLAAAGSVGALVGTLVVSRLSETEKKWAMLTVGTGCAGIGLLLFAFSPWFATSLALAGAVGIALSVYDATLATLLQLVSEDALRGRILGMYGLTWGFTPLGGFIAGAVASILSAPIAIGAGGIAIVSYAAGVLSRVAVNGQPPGLFGSRPESGDA